MAKDKIVFTDDEEDNYIPDLGEDPTGGSTMPEFPRSNAGVALDWSNLEQQMFDLLLLNRFVTDAHDTTEEQVDAIKYLLENFDVNEIIRIGAVASLAKHMEASDNKTFAEEYERYREYVRKNPADAEEYYLRK